MVDGCSQSDSSAMVVIAPILSFLAPPCFRLASLSLETTDGSLSLPGRAGVG
jgi:hypothetical protein